MFLHGGEEFARTKLGHHNSYNLPDSVNAVDWYRKKSHPTLFEHTRGMIAVRKAHPIFRLPSRAEIEARVHFRDDLVGHPTAIAVHYDGKGLAGEAWSEALVFINPDEHDHDFRLPEGDWDVYVQGAEAGLKRLLRACEVLPVLGRSVAVVARS
jgi:pullulanase